MKIKNLAITILMITFLIILGTEVEAATGIINEESVKLRKQPDSKTVLDLLNEGDEVEILESEEGWYKVKATTELGKVTGYVSEEYIDTNENANVEKPVEMTPTPTEVIQQPEESTETVSTDVTEEIPETTPEITQPEANTSTNIQENNSYTITQEIGIKALPLINSMEKSRVNGNITVIELINEWVRIENDADTGWVRKNTLKAVISNTQVQEETKTEEPPVQQPEEQPKEQPAEPTPEPEVTQAPEPTTQEVNKVGYVSTDGLRVRKGASTDTEEITSLSKNDKVQIIGKEGNWYKIDLDGEIGYVSAKYISDTKLPDTTSRSGSTLKSETTEQPTETPKEETPKTEEVPKVEETPAETTTPVTSGTTGTAIVEYAKQYLGYKYVSGGASPSKGFDCSGFTQYVYKHFGILINRTSGAQINNGVAVSKDNLQPGDLVVFNNDANTKIGHVGIYIGDGNFIHASNPSDGVKITTLLSGYYKQRYVGARRVF